MINVSSPMAVSVFDATSISLKNDRQDRLIHQYSGTGIGAGRPMPRGLRANPEMIRRTGPLAVEFLYQNSVMLCACFRPHLTSSKRNRRNWAKHEAISYLWGFIAEMFDEIFNGHAADVSETEIISDRLGKPHLLIGASEELDVSFSYEGRTMWTAVCRAGGGIGIDAAQSSSFPDDYPFHRAFQEGELEIGFKTGEAAAMIWSAKEAVVKALGFGFHFVDPLHLRVEPCFLCHGGGVLKVYFTHRTLEALCIKVENPVYLRILRHGGMWISVATINKG